MNSPWVRKAVLVFVLVGAAIAIGCGASGPEGSYRDAGGTTTLELKGGKAKLDFGQIHIDGTYTVDAGKLTIKPVEGDTSQTMVFTVNADGSIDPPPGSAMQKLQKVK